MDVEGAEKLVFEGARNLLSKNQSVVILFEATDLNACGFGYTVRNFLGELEATGLEIYYLNRRGQVIPVSDRNEKLGNEIYNFVATIRQEPKLAKG